MLFTALQEEASSTQQHTRVWTGASSRGKCAGLKSRWLKKQTTSMFLSVWQPQPMSKHNIHTWMLFATDIWTALEDTLRVIATFSYTAFYFGTSWSPWYFLCSNVPPPASWGESHAWSGSHVCLGDHGFCDLLRLNWGRKPLHLASTKPYHNIWNLAQYMKPNCM